MSVRYRGYLSFIAVYLVLVSGCAAHQQHRTVYDLCVNPVGQLSSNCDHAALQQMPLPNGTNYLLGFIEFDDQGHLWDRAQMWSVINLVSREASNKDLLMVVFVHGWKHSAMANDSNIKTFRKILTRLSEEEAFISQQSGRPTRQVAGVYLGWRGGSLTVPVIENLTFWDRKSTAQKVGHGGVTEVLTRLEQLKLDKDSTQSGHSATRLVVVGHSFGGLVVHSALNQILESRFVRTTGPAGLQSNVEGFGNLVVLINPAFEAQQFSTLSDMTAERGTYFDTQLPVIAILTSEADLATRVAFPAGRTASTLFEHTHPVTRRNAVTRNDEIIAESKANVTAIGHFLPYRTHQLYPSGAMKPNNDGVQATLSAAAEWEDDHPGSKIPFSDLTLERTENSAGRNPYLVVHVDKDLISDHNDIDDPRVVNFLKQLILISTISADQKAVLYRAFQVPRPTPRN